MNREAPTALVTVIPAGGCPGPVEALDFDESLAKRGLPPLLRSRTRTLQLNIGKRCNLACHHCHVESGPLRGEAMDARGIARILELLGLHPEIETLDVTGGAPEMNPHFRELVEGARALGRRVIDRCNLTIFYEPGHHDLPDFLAANQVEIVASLPCYTPENVERQRGRGVFDRSIEGLRRLNALGYGHGAPGLRLDLVYNPTGPTLPPSQPELEARYRAELSELFEIRFDHLLTITNMPIKRFAHDLERTGRSAEYLSLLVNHFNPATLPGLMCREMVSVAYDGRVYDCDFNQMLELDPPTGPRSIFDPDPLGGVRQGLAGAAIATATHCFGCTAGAGSSCGGALA